jgi:hypothetical protein
VLSSIEDHALAARILTLPSFSYLSTFFSPIDPLVLYKVSKEGGGRRREGGGGRQEGGGRSEEGRRRGRYMNRGVGREDGLKSRGHERPNGRAKGKDRGRGPKERSKSEDRRRRTKGEDQRRGKGRTRSQ